MRFKVLLRALGFFIQVMRSTMENVLLVISLLSCLAMIVAVLLQRSEGGALGMGGGGGGGLMSGRGAADTLVRVTMLLAAIFFCASLWLTRITADQTKDASDVERTIEEGGTLSDLLNEASSTETDTENSDIVPSEDSVSGLEPENDLESSTDTSDAADSDSASDTISPKD